MKIYGDKCSVSATKFYSADFGNENIVYKRGEKVGWPLYLFNNFQEERTKKPHAVKLYHLMR